MCHECYVVDLIWCTNISNASIPELVKHLLERTQATSWVIVLKALLTIHDIINYGNEVLMLWLFFLALSVNHGLNPDTRLFCVLFNCFIILCLSVCFFHTYTKIHFRKTFSAVCAHYKVSQRHGQWKNRLEFETVNSLECFLLKWSVRPWRELFNKALL